MKEDKKRNLKKAGLAAGIFMPGIRWRNIRVSDGF